MEYNHTLIIGGTGMLRAASIELAARSAHLTSVARTRRSLETLHAALPPGAGQYHPLPLDWSQPGHFLAQIEHHIEATIPPDLIVAWIHNDQLGLRLAAALPPVAEKAARFYHIIGSARRNPLEIADQLRRQLNSAESFYYHQVILGAHGSGANARWLTDEEISTGVLAAIDGAEPRFIAGSLGLWGAHG